MSITRIESYDPDDMSLISSDITSVDFGGIIRGKHCSKVCIVKPITEGTITELGLFLENNGGFSNAQFGFLGLSTLSSDITPGSAIMSDHFTENQDVSDFVTSDYGLMLTPETPGYIYLDAQIGLGSTIGSGTVNYRFVFEYN